jgi:hypothetical protein
LPFAVECGVENISAVEPEDVDGGDFGIHIGPTRDDNRM